MNNFRVTKCGTYFRTEYIKYTPGNVTIKVWKKTGQLHENRETTEKYMKYVLEMEKLIEAELKAQGLEHNPIKVVAFHTKRLESWSENFGIASGWSNEEKAKVIIEWFNGDYNKAKVACEETLANLKENTTSYLGDYRRHDQYKIENEMYELGMEDLEPHYGEGPLDKFEKVIDDFSDAVDDIKAKLNKK